MAIEFLYGAYKTLSLAFIAWLIGLPIGVLLSFISLRFNKYSHYLSITSVFLSVVPFLAILFWFHYPLQSILDVVWPPYFTVVLLLSLFISVMSGEILSEEMRKIKKSYVDAADVIGIGSSLFIRKIVFPAASESALPRLLNLAVVSIHMTMFASLIGVEELFRVSLRINSEYLQPVKIFSLMGLIYASICLPLYYISYVLNKKLKKNNLDA